MPREKIANEALTLLNGRKDAAEQEKKPKIPTHAEIASRLQLLRGEYERFSDLEPGDIVRFKSGLSNRPGLPPTADLMVLMRLTAAVLPETFDEAKGLNPEILNAEVGLLHHKPSVPKDKQFEIDNLDFVTLMVDANRLERVDVSTLEGPENE